MSARVDVLAVMDRSAEIMHDEAAPAIASADIAADLKDGAVELMKARAAVAELIEASREMMRQDAVKNTTFNSNPFMADAADRLSSALARVTP